MWQMVLAYIFVKGWIIDPDEHRFFYQSGEVVFLPSHYAKIVDVSIVTTDGTMVIDRGGGLEVFLQPFSKCSSCLTNIFFITLQSILRDASIDQGLQGAAISQLSPHLSSRFVPQRSALLSPLAR